jgi:hypothetical protein
MKRRKESLQNLPPHDYRRVLQTAVSSDPVARRQEPCQPFFVTAPRWHDAPRAAGPRSRKH